MLRRNDQKVLGWLVAVGLVCMAAIWVYHGGLTGRLIEIDAAPARQAEFLVDPNTADWIELAQLPEIGETLARRIVESRIAEGPFRSVEDLGRVQGIGDKTLEEIRPFVRIAEE